jgi:hypothetical protein
MSTNTLKTIRYADTIPADSTETLEYPVDRAGTVERVRIRIYEGAELALKIRPVVIRGDENTDRSDIIETVGKRDVDGDDDVWVFETSKPFENGQVVAVEVTNTDPDYGFDFACDISIDHENGIKRSASSVLGRWL